MQKKKKIVFRADASASIGYGHFIRSLALADMLKNNFDCVFATVEPTEYQIEEIKKVCFAVPLISNNHFQEFLSILSGEEIVVLDNYFFTTTYQKEIKDKGCKLVCVDDIHDKHYVADLVINHSVTDQSLFSVEKATKFCLGFEWALLRKPFVDAAISNKTKSSVKKISRVVVGFGGVDKYNLTGKTVEFLLQQESISQIDAIIGNAYQGNKSFNTNKKLFFHQNISAEEVARLFSSCDLAILSASTICIEALACKATVAAGYYVDNQESVYKLWNENKNIVGLDNLLDLSFLNKLETFLNSPSSLSFKLNIEDICQRYIRVFQEL